MRAYGAKFAHRFIIKIKEKRAEKTLSYEDISRDLAQYLAQQRVQLAMAKYIEDLYTKADVKVTITYESDKVIEEIAAKAAAEKAEKENTKKEEKKK